MRQILPQQQVVRQVVPQQQQQLVRLVTAPQQQLMRQATPLLQQPVRQATPPLQQLVRQATPHPQQLVRQATPPLQQLVRQATHTQLTTSCPVALEQRDQTDLRQQQYERARRLAHLCSSVVPQLQPQPSSLRSFPAQLQPSSLRSFPASNPVPVGSQQFALPVPPMLASPTQSVGARRAIFALSPVSASPGVSPASSTSTLAVPFPASPSSDQSVVTSPDMFNDSR